MILPSPTALKVRTLAWEAVVVLLLAVLYLMILPAVQRLDAVARRMDKRDSLKSLATAVQGYQLSLHRTLDDAAASAADWLRRGAVDHERASEISAEFRSRAAELVDLEEDIRRTKAADSDRQDQKLLSEAEQAVQDALAGIRISVELLQMLPTPRH